jgi:arylsulfatase A-like enzyme
MKLSERIPPDQAWATLSPEQKSYASRILAIRASMIENMDHDIGRVVQFLKDRGQYDNTLMIFLSDNGSSEPTPLLSIKFSNTAKAGALTDYIKQVNNTLSNLGNGSTFINYAAWGSSVGTSPLSGFKVTEYEGGTSVPFIVKEPGGVVPSSSGSNTPSSTANPKVIKALAHVSHNNSLTRQVREWVSGKRSMNHMTKQPDMKMYQYGGHMVSIGNR